MKVNETDNKYIAPTYSRFPVNIISGKGSRFYDDNGKEYLDLASGIAVNTFGACDGEWVEAVTKQLNTLQHTSNLYYTEPCSTLAKMLCEMTKMKKVFFSNSGAEANECAIKAARRRAFLKYGAGHHTIITLKNSFHGRTVTTLSATGQDSFHTEFDPFTEGFVYADANDFASVEELASTHKCAAIMFECVQGEGGVMPLEKDFLENVCKLAEKLDILTIADEVQTGNGRTGELYAYMNYGIQPDIVSTAKGLGGGLPIGATLLGEKAEDAFSYGTHGSTFGGNPVCCAAAINVLSRIDSSLLSEVKEKGDFIKNELAGCKGVRSVSGMGLMIGIECEKSAKDIISRCIERGVLVISAKTKVRLLPALNIPMEDLKMAISILKEVISE